MYGKVLAYEVDKISVVEPEDYGPLEIEEGKDLVRYLRVRRMVLIRSV